MRPGEKLSSLRCQQAMIQLGLSRDVVYKYMWDMRQKSEGMKKHCTKEQLREEIDDLADLLNIDVTPQAEAIVSEDSPLLTRDTLKISNDDSENSIASKLCPVSLFNNHKHTESP